MLFANGGGSSSELSDDSQLFSSSTSVAIFSSSSGVRFSDIEKRELSVNLSGNIQIFYLFANIFFRVTETGNRNP